MRCFKKFAGFFLVAVLLFSCENAEKPECITALDCLDGYLCLEGKCVDPNAGVDEDSFVLPDEVSGDKDTDSEKRDDNTGDDIDKLPADEDAVIFPDPDMVDEDTAIVEDKDLSDLDAVDADIADIDVTDMDSNDEDIYFPICGNAIPEEGEECDLGTVLNNGAYGGCKADCTFALRCGDGTKNGPELCDAGINNGTYGFCKADCTGAGERCGDGIPNGPEVCDDGESNGLYGYCNSFCTGLGLRCGDGYKNGTVEHPEECDAGPDNGVVTACTYGLMSCKVCDIDCKQHDGTVTYCGDGAQNGTESCDEGGSNGDYGHCNSDCSGINNCGDSVVTVPEICDDNTAVCNLIGGMGYNNTAVVDCNAGCDGWMTAACTCASGYEKDVTQKCVDTNECGDPLLNNCHANADCSNTSGSYNCTCKTNYSGDGVVSCVADTRVNQSCTGLPENAAWNTVSNISQTWNGAAWSPSTAGTFNAASSTTECRFVCNSNYTWNGSECAADTRPAQNCTGLIANAVWNTVSSIAQTWNGSSWLPTTTGSYNTAPSIMECRYKCDTNYSWSGSACVADTRTNQSCTGLPSNGSWNTASIISQTWNGSLWYPSTAGSFNAVSSTAECRFVCNANYTWNGSACVADTRANQSCTGLPSNGSWNTVSSITQTWNGSEWSPSTAGTFNSSSSTSECRFVCNANYTWNGSVCVADTRTNQSCTGLPVNGVWNTASVISQTWNGSTWIPSTAGAYNATPSTTECYYKCSTNYTWNGSVCVADTRVDQACSGLPANAVWNTASSINQTWNGSSWLPTTVGSYNESVSTTECRYKCAADHHLDGSSCVSNTRTDQSCTGLISNASWNTVSSISQTWNGSAWTPTTAGSYNAISSTTECRYTCNGAYHWDGSACVSNTRSGQVCTGIVSNADWNTVSTITQTWDGSGWTPATAGSYNTTGSTTECRFQCRVNYNWSGSACVAATQTASCSAKPSNTDWNDGGKNGTYTQTWNGSSWAPITSTTYNASAGDCRYICSSGYHWETSVCVSNTRTNQNCTGLVSNASWNTVSSITQTWNGSAWMPSTTGSYNTTPSTTECRYSCNATYHWDGSACVSDTRTGQTCTGLVSNASWNTVSTITQTWNGSAWTPTTAASYNTTGSTTECRFQCSAGFAWNGSACIGACPTAVSLGTWASGTDGWTIDNDYWLRSSGYMHLDYIVDHDDSYTKELTYTINTNLSGCSSATLKFAIQLGDDTYSAGEDQSEKLFVQCYNNVGGWTTMTPNPWPANQQSNCSGIGGYCAGGSGKNWSFAKTNQTISIPPECRISQARFRFQATGSNTWSLLAPGWYVYPVTIN